MPMQKLVIKNIGQILSGKLEEPFIDADCVIAIDGRISAIGAYHDLDTDQATSIVDAHGVTLAPGLIDSHVHCRAQSNGDCLATLVRKFPALRGENAGRCAGD